MNKPNRKHGEKVSIFVDKDLKQQLETISKEKKVSKSHLIRSFLDVGVAHPIQNTMYPIEGMELKPKGKKK